MNKKFLKSTLVVAMIAVTGYGSYKAYEGYAESSNWLLLENIEALAKDENQNKDKMYCYKKSQIDEDTYSGQTTLLCPEDKDGLDCDPENFTTGTIKKNEPKGNGYCWANKRS